MSSYFEPGPAWLRNGTTQIPVIYPTLANGAAVVVAGVWAFGAWVQIVASGTIGTVALIAVSIWQAGGAGTNHLAQLDIGQGAAGSEAVVHRFTYVRDGATGINPVLHVPVIPAISLTANARIAVRGADSAGLSDTIGFVWIHVLPRPVT